MSTSQMSQSTAAPTRSALHPLSPGARLIERARNRIVDFMTHLERRRAEADLIALDDRMLKDIGLDRSDIKWAVMVGMPDQSRGTRSRRSE